MLAGAAFCTSAPRAAITSSPLRRLFHDAYAAVRNSSFRERLLFLAIAQRPPKLYPLAVTVAKFDSRLSR